MGSKRRRRRDSPGSAEVSLHQIQGQAASSKDGNGTTKIKKLTKIKAKNPRRRSCDVESKDECDDGGSDTDNSLPELDAERSVYMGKEISTEDSSNPHSDKTPSPKLVATTRWLPESEQESTSARRGGKAAGGEEGERASLPEQSVAPLQAHSTFRSQTVVAQESNHAAPPPSRAGGRHRVESLRVRVADLLRLAFEGSTSPMISPSSPFGVNSFGFSPPPAPLPSPMPLSEEPLPEAAEDAEDALQEEGDMERMLTANDMSKKLECALFDMVCDGQSSPASLRDYRTRARSLAFNLRRNEDLRGMILGSQLSADKVVRMNVWELARKDLQEERVQSRDKYFRQEVVSLHCPEAELAKLAEEAEGRERISLHR